MTLITIKYLIHYLTDSPGGLSTVNGLSSGDYFVQIIDSSGCEIISSPIFVDNISILFATINTENSVLGVCSEDPMVQLISNLPEVKFFLMGIMFTLGQHQMVELFHLDKYLIKI